VITRKQLLWLLLEFIAITLPCTWLWLIWGEEAYWQAFRQTARPFMGWLGVTHMSPGLVKSHFVAIVPFLALVAITPGLTWRRRLVGSALGLVAIYASQILLVKAAFEAFLRHGQDASSGARYFPAVVFVDAVPFVLWAVIAHRFVGALLLRVMPRELTGAPAPKAPAGTEPEASNDVPQGTRSP